MCDQSAFVEAIAVGLVVAVVIAVIVLAACVLMRVDDVVLYPAFVLLAERPVVVVGRALGHEGAAGASFDVAGAVAVGTVVQAVRAVVFVFHKVDGVGRDVHEFVMDGAVVVAVVRVEFVLSFLVVFDAL